MSNINVNVAVPGGVARSPMSPKIELHVHLEGSVRARTLLQIAQRNDVPLPASTVEGLAGLYQFRDFEHFIKVWRPTTRALRTEQDFRQVVTDYAAEAASHGAVYLEGIFTPAEPVGRGAGWDEVLPATAMAPGRRPSSTAFSAADPGHTARVLARDAELTARHAVAYRDRGVVGVGLGGPEAQYPPEPYARAFEIARDGGLGSVPHAGEAAGASSIRGALDTLRADRIGTVSGPPTTLVWCGNWPRGAWCLTCA